MIFVIELSESCIYRQLHPVIKTDEDARCFGTNLGLDQIKIDEILQTNDYSDIKALCMFAKWKADCGILTDKEMIGKVTESITAVITSTVHAMPDDVHTHEDNGT